MIILQRGNLIDSFRNGRADAIAHGVNCSGGFGSGFAGQIAKEFPKVRQEYLKKYNEGKEIYQPYGWMLGDIQPVLVNIKVTEDNKLYYTNVDGSVPETIDKYIINCATQEKYGNTYGETYIDYEAIRNCMKNLHQFSKEHLTHISIPKIGTGLGGGDWEAIENIILDEFKDTNISVYVL